MKKIKLLAMLFTAVIAKAQVNFCGYNPPNSNIVANAIDCNDFMDGFKPNPLEPDLEVLVNVWVFQPSNAGGIYGAATIADANAMVNTLNNSFLNNPTPKLPFLGVTELPSTKIKFILKNFNLITDPAVYASVGSAPGNPAYVDPNAIDIYYGYSTSGPWGYVVGLPSKSIYIQQPNPITLLATNSNDNLVGHEMAHALGLNHTTQGQYSYNSESLKCCNQMYVNDYTIEASPIFAGCGSPFGSNNMVSQNAGCMYYLSPRQIAYMHYWLRKQNPNLLAPTSQNYIRKVNPALDLNITTNQTWSTDRFIKGNITVKTGKTLSINCSLKLLNDAKIFVEKGAKLIVDGGEISSLFNFGLWAGITIEGTSTGFQNLIFQGQVEVKNGGALKNAQVAINNFAYDASGNVNWGSTGGLIFCDNANFENNIKDVQFLYYHTPDGSPHVSNFKNTNFRITAPLNGGAFPDARVSIYEVDGVKFLGCNFENTTGSNVYTANWGIVSCDAKYTIDKNGTTPSIIKGFTEGVRVDNSNPLKLVTIKNTDFLNNYDYGVYFNNTNNLILEDNNFTMPSLISTNGVGFSSGVYLNSSKYYNVRNNNFNKNLSNPPGYANVGVTAYNSQNGAHNIYRNNFANLNVGILPIDNNSGASNNVDGLKMNCNDFTISQNQYDIALVNFGVAPTVHQIQGLTTNATTVVRNRYASPNISSNGENQFYIDNTSVKNYFHGSNINANAQPLPQPNLSDASVFVLPTSFPFNAIDCPSGIVPPNPCTSCNKLVNINSSINNANSVLQTAKTNYNNSIDGGNTTTLVAAVNSNMSNGNLKNLLENKSPYLSDAVLNAYFAKTSTPNGHIKDIHELNAPVSATVWQTIINRNLPNGIMNQILAKQNEKKFSTRDVLFANLANAQTNYQAMYAEKINYFGTDSLPASADSLISVLAINRSEMSNAKEQLFFAYLNKNDQVNAEKTTSDIATSNQELATYLNKLLSYQKAVDKAYVINKNSIEREFLLTFAKSNNMAGAGANSLLKFIKGINYSEPKVLPQGNNGGARIMNTISSETTEYTNAVGLYPNPTSNELNLVLSKQYSDTEITVIVSDALGKKVFEGKLKNNNSNTVSLENIKAGIYILNAYNKNSLVQSSKIVKID
ncbi:MAG: T9SS type A sorting domain-containing protein [Bacteroidetes bacterium]|nr:T9SS type A sorting domain-containing protein [Bacteroidota bacterium]MCA6444931.1 T9SS type A sorting domain-containing protein [Bacteroidota bacterium]